MNPVLVSCKIQFGASYVPGSPKSYKYITSENAHEYSDFPPLGGKSEGVGAGKDDVQSIVILETKWTIFYCCCCYYYYYY
jgi:hypothetical protein